MTYSFTSRLAGLLCCVCLSLATVPTLFSANGNAVNPVFLHPAGLQTALLNFKFKIQNLKFKSNDVCPRPELLQADQVTDSTARLTWSDVGDKYEIELVSGTAAFTGMPTYVVNADPPFDVSGLIPGVNYRFQVRTVCDDTTSSIWSAPRSFITDLNNARPCPLNLDLRDTSCNNIQVFKIHVDEAPGIALGADVLLRGARLMVEHPWRSDLSIWLRSPDDTRIQLIGGLNAGDKNIGDPQGAVCPQFVELSDDAAVAKPLSTAAEKDNITGYFLPVQTLATLHTGQNPVGIWQLEICDGKAVDKGKLRLVELVFARADCAVVSGVAVTNVAAISADVSWQTDAVGDSLLIEYGPSGFVPGVEGTAGNGAMAIRLLQPAVTPVPLAGLQTLQWYDVYMRRQCAPGVWGPNSYYVRFFTNCPATLLETVDTLPVCSAGCPDPCPLPGVWQNVPGDDYEWKVFNGPGLTYPVAGPAAAPGGAGNYLYFRNSCSPTGAFGKTAVLRTLCIDVSAPPAQVCHFSLDLYMNTKIGQMSSLMLQASTDGGQNWVDVKGWSGNRGKQWRREYVNLGDYDGQTVLFQLVATGTFGAYGDIAVDNLAFYGSQVAGTPDYVFYLDSDSDTYGDPDVRVISCFPQPPPGYVAVDSDCDDSDPSVYPGAPEILCNQIDENCNGMADDAIIPAPVAPASPEICSGQTAVLTAPAPAVGQYFWFASEQGGLPLASGATLTLNNLTSTHTYYLADSITGPSGGCVSMRVPVTVTVHPTPVLTLATTPSICDGSSFDLATLPVVDTVHTGGMLTFHSALPPGPANQLPSSIVHPGLTSTYYILSTTSFGCTGTKAVTVTVLPSPEVQIVQGDSINVCRGRTIQLQAIETGVGIPPITYAWSTGLNFPNIPVQAGNAPNVTKTYSVTATDANGCTSTDQINVHTLNNVTQTAIELVQNVSTCGGNDGSITLRPLNGTPPYAFAWSGGGMLTGIADVGTISTLAQGSYRITVTDATNAGCSMVMPQIVLNAPGLDVALDTIIHPACPGAPTGAILLNVNGQNPVFEWSDPMITGSNATALTAGVYSVTITDGNCAQVLSNLEVTGPPPIEINLNALDHVRCFGETNGLIDLAVFGATPPYQFAWSNDSLSEDLVNIPAGVYSCTITDANACTFTSSSYTVNEPPVLSIQVDSLSNVRCFGEKNGYLCIQALGGAGGYLYNWASGATMPCLGSVYAGVYSVTATDANACTAEWLGVVTQPSSLQIEFTNKENPTCIGAPDGQIELIMSGGQPPFQFLWSNGQTASLATNLGVGQYKATITDAAGCSFVSPSIGLSAPQLLQIGLDTLINVGCRGSATGLIQVHVDGAVGNIQASWNTIPDDLTLTNAIAGQYIVQITDERSCSVKDTFQITEPEAALSVNVISIKDALCAGEPTGSVAIRAIGGTAPYQYMWSNGAQTQNLPAVAAGSYGLTVTDAKGCTVVLQPVTVGEPPALVAFPTIHDIPCFGSLTGDIQLDVSGGMPPYHFMWSNNKSTQNIFNLTAGAYNVTVLDDIGCANVLTDMVVKDLDVDFVLEALTVLPVSCYGAADGIIAVRAVNGKAPYQYSWSPPLGLHANVPVARDTAKQLSGGDYGVTVTDAAGCTAVSGLFTVEEAPNLLLNITKIVNNKCKGDSTGLVALSVSGGVPPYLYLWNNGTVQDTARKLPAGTYVVTVTDSRGCSLVSPEVDVSEPAQALHIGLTGVVNDKCGKHEGAIQLQVSGGVSPYTYKWSNLATTGSLSGLGAGTYQLTTTDQLGCTIVSPVYNVLQLAPPLILDTALISNVLCRGDSTGAISPAFSGGTPGYQYAWSNGALTPGISGIPAGNYMLTLSDAAGCFDFWDFSVTQPLLALTATWTADSLAGGWTVTLSPAGGLLPYNIQWDAKAGNQTGPVVTGLEAGLYQVTVTDGNNCAKVFHIPVGTFTATRAPDLIVSALLSPNPTSGLARLELITREPVELYAGLYSALGQLLAEFRNPEKGTRCAISIDMRDHPAGLYWLSVRLSNGQITVFRVVRTD